MPQSWITSFYLPPEKVQVLRALGATRGQLARSQRIELWTVGRGGRLGRPIGSGGR